MSNRGNRAQTTRIAICGLLLALMLVLGWIESLLPSVGVPGVKLGLSNGVLIFAVYMLDIPTAYSLMALKVVLSGLMFSGVSAMLYAFAGGLMSLTAMCLMSRVKGFHRVVVSMVGGLMHNIGQVGMAMLILHNPRQMLYYMAILSVVGLACGAVTGVAADAVLRHLHASGWRMPHQEKKNGTAIIVAAVLLIACGVWAIRATQRPTGVVVTVEENQSTPALMQTGDLPFLQNTGTDNGE